MNNRVIITRAIVLGLLEFTPAKSWVEKNKKLIHIVLQILLILLAYWFKE